MILSILFCLLVNLLIDYLHFCYLKYLKKDIFIQNVKFGFNWWHYYFTNKYKKV